MTRDTAILIGVGGVAVVGGWMLWRQSSRPAGMSADDYGLGFDGFDLAGLESSLTSLFRPQAGVPVNGPGPYTTMAGPAPVARLGPAGPSGGDMAIKSGFAVGTGATVGLLGPGSALMGAATAGIGAGVAVLAWAIGSKGLFRGGEEALHVNPARDRYFAFWGPPGTGPGSGFMNLAARLTEITGEPNGSRYFAALKAADTRKKLIDATGEIQRVFASVGESVPAYVE